MERKATILARGQGPEKSTVTVGFKVVLVVFSLVVLLLAGSNVFQMVREPARRADSQAAMKQFGLDFKRYARESEKEMWPALASTDGLWVPELEPLYGKYRHVTSPANMISIYHPEKKRLKRDLAEAWNQPVPDFDRAAQILGVNFAYLGYCVRDELDFERLRIAKANDATLSGHTFAVKKGADEPIYRLIEGIERFILTDIGNPAISPFHGTIPVLIEIASWKYKVSETDFEGTNVLYMDGHVEFVPLGTFPVLPTMLDALSGL